MKQPLLQSAKLSESLKRQIKKRKLSYADVAKLAHVDASRVSKICEGNFKRLTPILNKVCEALNVNSVNFVRDAAIPTTDEVISDVHRFVGGRPDRARALQKVLRIVAKVL